MSKADGQLIKMVFSEKFTNNFETPLAYKYAVNSGVTVTVSGGVSSVANMANGVYTDYGYVSNAVGRWIQLQLPLAKAAKGMRWYVNSDNYAFTGFTVSGSNDGSTFTDIATLTGTASSGWHEFAFDAAVEYLYYRFTCTTYSGSYFYCNEIELKTVPAYNEIAFTLSGNEYNMEPGGVLVAKEYSIGSIEAYPDDDHSLLLTTIATDRFERVVGDLTVAYDSSKGNLSGLGGPVVSFSQSFAPSDLLNKINPNDQENVEIVEVAVSATLIKIYYSYAQCLDSNVELSNITASGVLTNINDL